MAVKQGLLRIALPPVLQIGEAGWSLARLVIDMGANVGAIGIAWIGGE
jgi:hypothetical protein